MVSKIYLTDYIDKAGDIVFKIKEDIILQPLTFFDNYFIGRNENGIIVVFDKNGNMYDLSSYIDYKSFLLSSSNVFFTYNDDNTRGYFKIISKGEK